CLCFEHCCSLRKIRVYAWLVFLIFLDECFDGFESGVSQSMGHLGLSYEIADVKGRIAHPGFFEVYDGCQIVRDDDVARMVVSMNGIVCTRRWSDSLYRPM